MRNIFLIAVLFLNGCYAIGAPFSQGDIGGDLEKHLATHDVYKCGKLGGPPPTGVYEFIVVPKGQPIPAGMQAPRC